MSDAPWVFTQSDGDLLVHTGVAGRAARLGHRLTIRMATWQATVRWDGDRPVSVEAQVDAESLELVSGEGGVTPLSGPERTVARSNALSTLDVADHPAIVFRCEDVVATDRGFDLAGTLAIHGVERPHTVPLVVVEDPDGWELSFESPVVQTDHGIKPYSLMMGSLKVADEVLVTLTARRSRS